MRRGRVAMQAVKRDIIREYADLGSQVFAPLTRIGSFPDRNCEKFKVETHFLDSYNGRPCVMTLRGDAVTGSC
jgi:hypothetical protein